MGDDKSKDGKIEDLITINDQDKTMELIAAAKDSDTVKVKELILSGVNPNGRDEEGRTALHWAVTLPCPCSDCGKNAESCLFVLFSSTGCCHIDVNAQDNFGLTPLHIAAESQLEKCCKMLVYNGADIYKCSKEGVLAITLIAKQVPNVVVYLLDNAISLGGNFPVSERCTLSMDFRILLGDLKNEKMKMQTIDTPPEKYGSCNGQNEMHLLRSLLRSSKMTRTKIFTHPTVGVFLDQKWLRVRKHFWFTFICYVIWLLLFTSYILMTYLIDCPCKLFTGSLTIKSIVRKSERIQEAPLNLNLTDDVDPFNISESREEWIEGYSKCIGGSMTTFTVFLTLLVLTAIMAINEIAKILATPKLYFKSRLNILHWILLVMSLVTFYPTFTQQTQISSTQHQVAALTIFLAWSLILSQVGKFPSIGIYLEIFGHVLKQFWFFLLTYVSLFIAFALAFSILFPGSQPYTIFPFAFLKIFVMMVGEMEYQDVFYDEATGRASGPIIGHLLYATFVVVVAIVLMNLLIGLTVSDIRGLQKEAEMNRVSRQIVDMFHLESFLYSDKIPHFIKKSMYQMTSVAVALAKHHGRNAERTVHSGTNSHEQPFLASNKYVFKFLPNDSRDKSVPEKLKACAMELAMKLEHERKEKVCVRKKMYGQYGGQTKYAMTTEKPPFSISNAVDMLKAKGLLGKSLLENEKKH